MSKSSSSPKKTGSADPASAAGVGAGECASCGQPLSASNLNPDQVPAVTAVSSRYMLTVGRLRVGFPDSGLQQEYAQAAGIHPDAPVESSELKSVIAEPDNRYLARQVCWIFTAQSGDDACTVLPRSEAELDDLIDLLAPEGAEPIQALVGSPALTRTPFGCWAGDLPAVWPAQVLSFTMDGFTDAMAAENQPDADEKSDVAPLRENPQYRASVRDLFLRFTQRSGNVGVTDEDRAYNLLALKDPSSYALNWQARTEGKNLTNITARAMSKGTHRIVDVRFYFRHHKTHMTETYHCQVDTTDLFCYKSLPLSPTYD
jgi:hypothetical protein